MQMCLLSTEKNRFCKGNSLSFKIYQIKRANHVLNATPCISMNSKLLSVSLFSGVNGRGGKSYSERVTVSEITWRRLCKFSCTWLLVRSQGTSGGQIRARRAAPTPVRWLWNRWSNLNRARHAPSTAGWRCECVRIRVLFSSSVQSCLWMRSEVELCQQPSGKQLAGSPSPEVQPPWPCAYVHLLLAADPAVQKARWTLGLQMQTLCTLQASIFSFLTSKQSLCCSEAVKRQKKCSKLPYTVLWHYYFRCYCCYGWTVTV